MDYQRSSDFSNREKSDNYFPQGRLTRQQSVNQHYQDRDISTNSADRRTDSYFYSDKPTDQRPTGRYGQYQRPTEESSRSSSSDYSAQRRPTGQPSANQYSQRPSSNQSGRRTDSYSSADRYGQYQRATGDSGQSQSSDYSAQRRSAGQPSASQYGQHPSSNSSNQSDRRSDSYAPSRRPVEQCPDDRYGQYQRPVQEGNPRQTAQQSGNPSAGNASGYSPSRSTTEQRPVAHGQYQQLTQKSKSRSAMQSSKISITNPTSKKEQENQSANHHAQYASNKNKNRKSPVKTIIIGVAALVILFVFAVIRMKRDGGSISLPTDVPGEAEVTYNYIDDDQIVKKDLIGTELTYDGDSIASGTMKYQFKNVTAYNNIYELCGEELKNDIDNPSLFKLNRYDWGVTFSDDGTKKYEGYSKRFKEDDGNIYYNYRYPEIFDMETGLLRYGCYIFVFEIELTNIDALSDTTHYSINNPNEFRISGMFNLVNRSGEKPIYGQLCYFTEELDANSEGEHDILSYHLVINPGETKTIHLGYFLIGDESEHPYSRMGLADEGHTSTYDDSTVFLWFDMSDVISKENNTVE